MMPESVWLAEMESEHYSWRAVGATEMEAIDALERGWVAHVEQYADQFGEEPMSPVIALTYYGANTNEIPLGGCLRDTSTIYVPEGTD